MVEQPNHQKLMERVALLEKESAQRLRLETINTALFRISNAASTATSRQELYRTIHLALSPIIDTANFFIALYEKNDDSLTFPYIVDTVDASYPPVINVSKTASLTAAVIRSQAPLLIQKDEILKRQAKSGLIVPICTPAEIWLGAPLKTQRGIIGVVAVQSYKDANCYDQTDMNVLVSVADMVAITLERKHAETALQEKNLELQQAMNQIKTLRGIVPICMNCKKIRDDQGYWNQVEVYVRNHTEAEFSHGVCPDCIVKIYPEYSRDSLTDDKLARK